MPYLHLIDILSSNKLAISNEGDLVKLVEDFIKYRKNKPNLKKLPEENPEKNPKFWDNLTKEEKEAREKINDKKAEDKAKEKEEEEKKETERVNGLNDKCEAFC